MDDVEDWASVVPKMVRVGFKWLCVCVCVHRARHITQINTRSCSAPSQFCVRVLHWNTQDERFRVRAVLGEVRDGVLEQSVLCGGGADGDAYWYPASAVKLCAAVAGVEWINAVANDCREQEEEETRPKVSLDTPLHIEGRTAPSTIGHLIRMLFIVSDNDAYNDILDICGRDFVMQRMRALDLRSIVLNHKLGTALRAGDAHNRMVPALRACTADREPGFARGCRDAGPPIRHSQNASLGVAHVAPPPGALIHEPLDCGERNRGSLEDLQRLMCLIVRPEVFLPDGRGERAMIHEEQRLFLMEAMRALPTEAPEIPDDEEHRERFPADYKDRKSVV